MSSLRILSDDDYNDVWTIFHSVFEHKYIREFQDSWSSRNEGLSYGFFDEQRILIGFLLTKQIQDRHQQIEFIGVHPVIQKGGVGSILLRTVVNYCQNNKISLTLIPVNDEKIINWYKKNGFEPFGEPRLSPYTGELEQTMKFAVK